MWIVKPAAMPVQFLMRPTVATSVGYSHPPPHNYDGIHRRFINIPTKSQTSESVGGLGQQILLRTADSNPSKPIPKEKEISGSDVLWAIQRATAQRKRTNAGKKKMKKIRGVELSSSAGESTEDNGVDYSNVAPLRIKSDWGHRLEEFEKLLKEFQDTEL
ncbi:unnamed protein product [Arabidopsis lyrata]|uniref:Uncharacterized protein n=1 Tax=Arabidopsis lyrata subsp. lyrata TaxID=81972 RepID=D7LF82_ARALL|nr:uncharacterized protein LOC9316329 [Arabidopsis lyrata subsp. lyrata]EFH56521.1 hypothetical protein ARALYDRAFT_904144 [Arabidopsis lyrata subsp. lyrata]CAH8266207.1 unnamed protein product [Arabidopsis lyrata]|eukprot:XP_002880262.1 uncharacterized protein LOC9316329 [Arabidopsis lyrata subsp. lyrata]